MNEICECSLIILTEDQNWIMPILHNCIHQDDPTKISLRLKVYSKLKTPDYFFLGKNFWILSSMLTLSFIPNFAPKKFKAKTMDRKTKVFTGKLPCSSPSRIHFSSKEAPPTEILECKNLVQKNCTLCKQNVFCTRRKSYP